MKNLNCENESIERKYLKMRKNQFLKVKNSLLELEKDFTELKIERYRIERYRSKKLNDKLKER